MIKTDNTFPKKVINKDNSLTLKTNTELKAMKLITVDSIFEKYPFIVYEMKWTRENIELFVDSYLLIGEKKDGVLYIDTDSFEKLINYHREVNKKEN
jgi:hypothetical protein